MKIYILLMAFAFSNFCYAQHVDETNVETYPLHIGWDMTTVLVFPDEVSSADFGSPAVLAQKDKSSPNVLKLKAGQRNFLTTSMYVITKRGKLYPFSVSYTEYPDVRPIDIGKQENINYAEVRLDGIEMMPSAMHSLLESLLSSSVSVERWGTKQGKIRIGLGAIVEKEGLLFLQFAVENRSGINYQPAKLEYTVQDKNTPKRTAKREIAMKPVAFSGFKNVPGNSISYAVAAFPRFTISDTKEFTIRVFEQNGDRNPLFSVSGRNLLKAGTLDDFHLNQ